MERDWSPANASSDEAQPHPFPWIPPDLNRKLYKARGFEGAARFEPGLNELIKLGYEDDGEAGMQRRVEHYHERLDAEIEAIEAETRRRRRMDAIELAAKTASGVAVAVLPVITGTDHRH